ncbi:hypothetical protein [Nocardia wallacei]|uniref:hypothetical protein n=1 Tax=Nocardia wallacei TaxID=480035 RepID=UPI0024571041|nr:hypothetical protein [Nocardia wallacei]
MQISRSLLAVGVGIAALSAAIAMAGTTSAEAVRAGAVGLTSVQQNSASSSKGESKQQGQYLAQVVDGAEDTGLLESLLGGSGDSGSGGATTRFQRPDDDGDVYYRDTQNSRDVCGVNGSRDASRSRDACGIGGGQSRSGNQSYVDDSNQQYKDVHCYAQDAARSTYICRSQSDAKQIQDEDDPVEEEPGASYSEDIQNSRNSSG